MENSVAYKKCSQCHVEKPIEAFHKDSAQRGGYKFACKECARYRRKHPRIVQQPLFVVSKVCSVCHVEKPLDQFHHTIKAKDGYKTDCKPCRSLKKQQWRIKRYPKRERLPPISNGVKICRTCRIEKPLDQFGKDKRKSDGRGAQCKQCIHHREHVVNQERSIARTRRNWEKNGSAYKAQHREWAKDNSLVLNEIQRRRNARERGASVGRVSYKRILARDGAVCYICEQAIDLSLKNREPASLAFDHEKPLAGIGDRKGTHTEDNIHPTHRVCNSRKGVKLLDELTSHDRRGV